MFSGTYHAIQCSTRVGSDLGPGRVGLGKICLTSGLLGSSQVRYIFFRNKNPVNFFFRSSVMSQYTNRYNKMASLCNLSCYFIISHSLISYKHP